MQSSPRIRRCGCPDLAPSVVSCVPLSPSWRISCPPRDSAGPSRCRTQILEDGRSVAVEAEVWKEQPWRLSISAGPTLPSPTLGMHVRQQRELQG